MNWKDVKFFIPDEFLCSHCKTSVDMDYLLISSLDWLRNTIGVPFIVTSGYRCPSHNQNIGGHPRSFHLFGKAADITVSRKDLLSLIYQVAVTSKRFNGIGIAQNYIHFDMGNRVNPYYYVYLPGGGTKGANPELIKEIQKLSVEEILKEYKA